VIAGGTLQLTGFLTIGANAVGKVITKSGAGTLIIDGPQSHQPGTAFIATAGLTRLNSSAGANAALTVTGSATVVLGDNQDLRDLNVTFADPGLQKLDLNSPAAPDALRYIQVFAADLPAAKSALSAAIANALTNPGDGIIDSGLTFHPNSAIGIAVISDHILIRPTRIGDLNLDGMVTISDFIDLASHFNSTGTWQEGDLNYDGAVTISDFIDLASNFNTSYSGDTWPISPEDHQILIAFEAANVPEPQIVGVLTGGWVFLARRRRSKSGA